VRVEGRPFPASSGGGIRIRDPRAMGRHFVGPLRYQALRHAEELSSRPKGQRHEARSLGGRGRYPATAVSWCYEHVCGIGSARSLPSLHGGERPRAPPGEHVPARRGSRARALDSSTSSTVTLRTRSSSDSGAGAGSGEPPPSTQERHFPVDRREVHLLGRGSGSHAGAAIRQPLEGLRKALQTYCNGAVVRARRGRARTTGHARRRRRGPRRVRPIGRVNLHPGRLVAASGEPTAPGCAPSLPGCGPAPAARLRACR
jgi:hypothetical protein